MEEQVRGEGGEMCDARTLGVTTLDCGFEDSVCRRIKDTNSPTPTGRVVDVSVSCAGDVRLELAAVSGESSLSEHGKCLDLEESGGVGYEC